MSIEQRIQDLGISLASGTAPAANYANAVRTGNLLFISGKASLPVNGKQPKGKLGREFSVQDGYSFARSAAIDLIAVMKAELGSLERVARIVEVQGFLNATEDFEEHPQVLNGCSDLLVDIFGNKGIHARSVIGVNSLRGGVPVVIKAIVEITQS